MTCVVGIRTKAGVLLAADSQVSWDNRKAMDQQPKVFRLSDVLAIGYCGSGRLGQLLQHHMDGLNDPPLGRDDMTWAVKTFVPYVRDVLAEGGFLHLHNNVENFGDSAFLFAVRGRLFQVEGDFCVNELGRHFDAVGSGTELALGAMATYFAGSAKTPDEDDALEIAQAGVDAAIEHTAFVGGGITSVSTALFTEAELSFARQMLREGSR